MMTLLDMNDRDLPNMTHQLRLTHYQLPITNYCLYASAYDRH